MRLFRVFSILTILGSAAILAFAPNVQAEEITGSGTVTYLTKVISKSKLADGNSLNNMFMKGMVIASDENVPVHLSRQDCTGATIVAPTGEQLEGAGSCNGLDRDGDIWWIWWRNTSESRLWGFLGGTGKYQGVEGGGTTEVLSAAPDGRVAVTWQGKWVMK